MVVVAAGSVVAGGAFGATGGTRSGSGTQGVVAESAATLDLWLARRPHRAGRREKIDTDAGA
jgi:hypothetical protein